MATGDLTTLANVKAYLQIPTGTTNYDAYLTSLITLVTGRIQNDCGRIFYQGNYLELHNLTRGQTRLVPFNKPIIQINRLAWGVSSAFQLVYTGAAVSATASVTPARQLLLQTIDATGLHTTTIDLNSTSFSLCSQVITQINTVSGFAATLYANIDVPTRWLYPAVNMTLKSYNSVFTQGFGFASVDVFSYVVDPVYNTISFQPFTLADFVFSQGEMGGFAFPGMTCGCILDYVGGYATIPQDVDLLAQQVTADVFNLSQNDANLATDTLGDRTVSMIDPMLRRSVYADLLAPYRRPQLAGGIG